PGSLNPRPRLPVEWPLAQQRRQHIHPRIDAAELPVPHVTRRQGRPYTLVLNKTHALFTREQQARARDHADLEWLAEAWDLRPMTPMPRTGRAPETPGAGRNNRTR